VIILICVYSGREKISVVDGSPDEAHRFHKWIQLSNMSEIDTDRKIER